MADVAVVICNYNKKSFVLECIESVLGSDFKDFDLIVVDNASEDGSAQAIKDRFSSRLTLIENSENLGGSGGFNIGMQYALNKNSYQYIQLLDDDVVIDKNAIGELYKFMEKHPETGVCGSLICKAQSKTEIQEYGSIINYELIGVTHLYTGDMVTDLLPDKVSCDYVPACSAMYRIDVLKKTGVIDKDYFIYWDDMALCWEIRSKGYVVNACAKSIVWHHGSYGTRTAFSRYYSLRNKIHCFVKYLNDDLYDQFPENLVNILFRMFVVNHDDQGKIRDYFHALNDALNNVRGKASPYKLSSPESGNESLENMFKDKDNILFCNHILDVEKYDRSKIYIDNYGNKILENESFTFFESYEKHRDFFHKVFFSFVKSKLDALRETIYLNQGIVK